MSGDSKDEGELQTYFDDLLDPGAGVPASEYAEPEEEERQRLQKLLYSAAPKPEQRVEEPPVKQETIEESLEVSPVDATASMPTSEPVCVPEPPPEATPEPETKLEPEPSSAPVPDTEPPEPHPTPMAEWEPEPQTATTEPEAEETTPSEAPPVEADAELSAEDFAYQAKDLDWLANGRPPWAQERFDALLFTVSGLTLAVPLISLGQIQSLNDELTPLAGHADWFMGIQPTPTGRIRTVNTAKFVMPERYDESFEQTAKYVISIDGVPWGLAVDSVKQPVSLDPDDVKWRGERSKRPWLAGTVKEHMCALLDVPRIGQLLMEAQAGKSR